MLIGTFLRLVHGILCGFNLRIQQFGALLKQSLLCFNFFGSGLGVANKGLAGALRFDFANFKILRSLNLSHGVRGHAFGLKLFSAIYVYG
jgi:hypothetical protein